MIRTVGMINTHKPMGGAHISYANSYFAGTFLGDDTFDSQFPPLLYEQAKAHDLGIRIVDRVLQQTEASFQALAPEGDFLKNLLQCVSGIAAHTAVLNTTNFGPKANFKDALDLYGSQVHPSLQAIFKQASDQRIFPKYAHDHTLWQSPLSKLALSTAEKLYTCIESTNRQSLAECLSNSQNQMDSLLEESLSPHKQRFQTIINDYLSNAKAFLESKRGG